MNDQRRQEVKQKVENMDIEEMNRILRDFYESKHYPAFLRYLKYRMNLLYRNIMNMDPQEQKIEMARKQGVRTGLLDLFQATEISRDDMKASNSDQVENWQDLDSGDADVGDTVALLDELIASNRANVEINVSVVDEEEQDSE